RRRPRIHQPAMAQCRVPQGQDRTRDSSTQQTDRTTQATTTRATPREDVMTQIKLNTALGGHAAGATIKVTPKSAELLIESGHAEAVEVEAKASRGRAKKTVDNPVDNGVGGASPDADSP